MSKVRPYIPTITAIVMVLITISLYFFPFVAGTDIYDEYYTFSLFDNLKESSRYIDTLIVDPELFHFLIPDDMFSSIVIIPIIIVCLYVLLVFIGMILAFFAKRNHKILYYYYLPFTLSIIYCAYNYFHELVKWGTVLIYYPLAIFSLVMIFTYTFILLLPRILPKIKEFLAQIRKSHPHKPTKSERIAELERQVTQLQSKDKGTE